MNIVYKTLILLLLSNLSYAQIYVDGNAAGNNDGSSWSNAYTDLQDALDAVNVDYQEVWIKSNTYKPTRDYTGNSNPTDPRTKRFTISTYITIIRGGFNGTETASFQSNPDLYPTIIDGNIGILSDSLDNIYTLFYCEVSTAFIGLEIINSNSNGDPTLGGSAIYSVSNDLVSVMRCKMKNNYSKYRGGAIAIFGSIGSLLASETLFENNRSLQQGGAIYSEGQCHVSICHFDQCRSSYGGAIKFWGISDNRVEFSSFTQCQATPGKGASIQIFNSTVTIANCSFYGNINSFGEFSSYDQFGQSSFNVYNSIIVNNSATTIENVDSGTNPFSFHSCMTNIALTAPASNCTIADPLFVNPPSNLTLQSCSPAIENSTAFIMPSYLATPSPQEGNYRELGSKEYFSPVVTPSGTSYLYMANGFPIEPSSWQWIDCSTNTPIAGETATTFSPSTTGSYAIVAIFPNCSDTSNCESFTVATSGISEININSITVYPNPAQNVLNIQLSEPSSIVITDINGQQLLTSVSNTDHQLNVSNLQSGIYFIQTENRTTQKFIKQ